jgi:hypothetical protein
MSKLFDVLEKVKYGEEYEYIKIDEDIDEDIEVLEEGIKFFKASQRLKKLADRLQKKDMKEMSPIIERTRKAASEFERIEGKFEKGEITKTQARLRIDSIKRNYNDIMKMLRGKEFGAFLKVGGIVAILGGIVASIIFGFQPLQAIGITLPSWDKIKNTLGLISTAATREYNTLKKAFEQKVLPAVKSAVSSL